MYKKGFTLQELLVSMAIVGIIAGVIAPAINAIMPDKRKAMYLKAYNTLTNLTDEILSDPLLYWTTYNDTTGAATCSGLNCTSQPTNYEPCNEPDWQCTGVHKFGRIFATKVNYVERTSPMPSSVNGTNVKTIDGMDWTIYSYVSATNGDNSYIMVIVDVNSNNKNEKNKCAYISTSCPNPDMFEFKIDNEGGISAEDPLGKAFLKNPTDMNSIRADKDVAKSIEKSGS